MSSAPLERLIQNYTPAFLAFLNNPDEERLHRAYELGRTALADGITLLDLVRTHHIAFGKAITTTDAGTQAGTIDAAASFLIEALAPYEMARRGYLERARDDRPPPPD
jgi:hypothetical protein